MREGTTSRLMSADRPYGESYDFYSVSPEYFGFTFVYADRWTDSCLCEPPLKTPYTSKVMVVGNMPVGCCYFPVLLSGPWHTLADLTTVNKKWLAICVTLWWGLLCGTCDRALRHLLLARVPTVTIIHSRRLLFTKI
jgi:hypothetical protein